MKTAAQIWREQWVYCADQYSAFQATAFQLKMAGKAEHAKHYAATARALHHEVLYAQDCHWACLFDEFGANDPTYDETPTPEGDPTCSEFNNTSPSTSSITHERRLRLVTSTDPQSSSP